MTKYDRQCDLEFRSANYRADADLTSAIGKLAAAVQTRAALSEEPCTSCAGGKGPFKDCRRISEEEKGRCANYIVRGRSCDCGVPKWEKPVPVDQNIPYTTLEAGALYHSPREMTTFDFAPYLRQHTIGDDDRPSKVEIWCLRCQESTKVVADGRIVNTFVDTEPR